MLLSLTGNLSEYMRISINNSSIEIRYLYLL